MPKTYDLIGTTTLSTAVSTFTVTLPSTYTDIQIKASLRSSGPNFISGSYLTLNTDTNTTRYSRATIYDEDGGIGAELSFGGGSSQQFGAVMASQTPANTFTAVTVDLINYQSTTTKTYLSFSTGQRQGGATRNIWRNTHGYNQTTPISQLSFIDMSSGGAFIIGSSISIYGIKKA
jgi:hypothetical protein